MKRKWKSLRLFFFVGNIERKKKKKKKESFEGKMRKADGKRSKRLSKFQRKSHWNFFNQQKRNQQDSNISPRPVTTRLSKCIFRFFLITQDFFSGNPLLIFLLYVYSNYCRSSETCSHLSEGHTHIYLHIRACTDFNYYTGN